MEEYLRIKDEFKIDDSHSRIRGFVVCKTEDGKILFTKENMIVKKGRQLILSRLLNLDAALPDFHVVSGNEYKMTSPDNDISTGQELYDAFGTAEVDEAIESDSIKKVEIDSSLENDSESNNENIIIKVKDESLLPEGSYCVNLNDLYIHFKLKKQSKSNGSVTSSFGLAIADQTANTGYRLFSRVTFPSYPDSVNLIFDYYIYF